MQNLKVKKSVLLTSPIFALKYSYFRPYFLVSCQEDGSFSLIDTHRIGINSSHGEINNNNEGMNNTLKYSEISPLIHSNIHNNVIYDIEWCFSDNKLLTCSGDSSCIMLNLEDKSNGYPELLLSGHNKSVKSVKQSIFEESIIASCGRDHMIYIWDLRVKNSRFCNKNCQSYQVNHIHVKYP